LIDTQPISFVVFPFLPTSQPIDLAGITLYSTDDTAHLSSENAKHVETIARMLFLQDDVRVKSATYATVPASLRPIRYERETAEFERLERLQSLIAYCYCAPHRTLGTPFLSYEHASLAIFTPELVSVYLLNPRLRMANSVSPEEQVPGYHGLYNFRHHFWVANESRLYPPVVQIGPNDALDLAGDLDHFFTQSLSYRFVPQLLTGTDANTSQVLTAIEWFNRANRIGIDEEEAILHLAVAFEALLGIPADQKTERLTDAIALLLGRVPRLQEWGHQFYEARSQVVHEGRTQRLRFNTGTKNEENLYHPLLSFGRQIFQLSTSTLLFGASLSVEAGLEERLVTNRERFEQLCKLLADGNASPAEQLDRAKPVVSAILRYRFVPESNLRIETILGAVRLAAEALINANDQPPDSFKKSIEQIARAPRSADQYEIMAVLAVLQSKSWLPELRGDSSGHRRLMLELATFAWYGTFGHYYWLKRQREAAGPQETKS
jgi:hypothetical protein